MINKKDKHPKYYDKSKITCACGNRYEIGSTVAEMNIEICSACHPFYTGKHKFVDSAGRVDKFQERVKKAQIYKQAKEAKKIKKTTKK